MEQPMPPKISVVLPAYNRADSIQMAAQSVLRQTWDDFELLIVDDCSTDATAQAIRAISDPRVRCLTTPQNMGPSGARNTGIEAARGEWVAFQDSDDEWLPEKLDRQMARLQARGMKDIGVYCGMIIVGTPEGDDSTRTTARYHPDPGIETVEGDIAQTLLRHSLISTQTLMARRDLLNEIGGFDAVLPALVDWECVIRLAQKGSFAFVDSPLVHQNFSINSVTKDRWRRAEARRSIVEKHLELMSARPDILAQHWRAIAGDERRLGKATQARQALAQARKLRPGDPALWALSAMMAFKRDKNP
jgi:glycosyltransferase involved in cell wall biosynthesis